MGEEQVSAAAFSEAAGGCYGIVMKNCNAVLRAAHLFSKYTIYTLQAYSRCVIIYCAGAG